MLRRAGFPLRLIVIAVDLGWTALALYLARLLRLTLPFGVYLDEPLRFTPWFYLLVPMVWLVVLVALRVYHPGRALRYVADLQSVWGAVTMSALVFAGITYLFFREFSRLLFFYFYLLDLFFLAIWRAALPELLRRLGHRLGRPSRVLIVGAGQVGSEVGKAVLEHRWAGLDLIGFLDDDPAKQKTECLGHPVFGPLATAPEVVAVQGIDEVVMALPSRAQAETERLALDLQSLPVNVRLVPDVFSMIFIRASVEDFAGIPLIGLREPAIEGMARATKRAFDLVIAGGLLLLAAPAMAVIAAAIRLESSGPVFFRQQRAGENGKLFEILKFRTMAVGSEAWEMELAHELGEGPPLFEKRPDDPRVTRVGRILRRWSLDELPQLFNVLKGDMSLVGPRPELPWLVERYEPWQRKRFAVPQGMTGWWQVRGRSDRADHRQRVEDDLYYIRNWSMWLDLRILWMTIGAVLRGEGAY
jgi:exopolysaccharide biosynthesis polyprenyl glycosylphosphotransferase